MVPYKIKKECYLLRSCPVDARTMLLFTVEQVFLPMGDIWSMQNADTQCTVVGERGGQWTETFLCLNFSCLAIKCEFYFTLGWDLMRV